MAKYICTTDSICTEQINEQTKANQKSGKSAGTSLRQLVGTISGYAVEIYHYNNDSEPVFANGRTRVLFRPGRIDLI